MGLLVTVYRPVGYPDCSNDGMSATHKGLCLMNVSGPFEPSADYAPALLESHQPGILRVVPAYPHGGGGEPKEWRCVPLWWMNGGNIASCSDSRFAEACERLLGHRFYGGVHIHDRTE